MGNQVKSNAVTSRGTKAAGGLELKIIGADTHESKCPIFTPRLEFCRIQSE